MCINHLLFCCAHLRFCAFFIFFTCVEAFATANRGESELKNKMMKLYPQFGVFPCNLCPSQLRKRGEVIGRVRKRRLELMHQKDANVRQVELNPIIKGVAEKGVGKWENASNSCYRVVYTTKYIEKCRERKLRSVNPRENEQGNGKGMNKLFDISHRRLPPELHDDKRFLRDKKRKQDLHVGPSLDRHTTVRWQRQQHSRQQSEREAGAAASARDTAAASATGLGRRTSRSCGRSIGRSVAVFG